MQDFQNIDKDVCGWTENLLARYLVGPALEIVLVHSKQVTDLALAVATRLQMSPADLEFITQAAMLHDIGVCQVYAPELGLHGAHPYIMHGVLGRMILDREGLPQHALVCERHTGVGLTCADIVNQKLPLPVRDMCPQSRCEQIICFADLFYSKRPGKLLVQKSVERVRKGLANFGADKVAIFNAWLVLFGDPPPSQSSV